MLQIPSLVITTDHYKVVILLLVVLVAACCVFFFFFFFFFPLLVCLINALDLHVVSIAKLYVIKNLNLNLLLCLVDPV